MYGRQIRPPIQTAKPPVVGEKQTKDRLTLCPNKSIKKCWGRRNKKVSQKGLRQVRVVILTRIWVSSPYGWCNLETGVSSLCPLTHVPNQKQGSNQSENNKETIFEHTTMWQELPKMTAIFCGKTLFYKHSMYVQFLVWLRSYWKSLRRRSLWSILQPTIRGQWRWLHSFYVVHLLIVSAVQTRSCPV